jgi:hypothetical protein
MRITSLAAATFRALRYQHVGEANPGNQHGRDGSQLWRFPSLLLEKFPQGETTEFSGGPKERQWAAKSIIGGTQHRRTSII